MNVNKTIAIAAAAVIIIAALGAVVFNTGSEGGKNEKGGLYQLDASVLSVDMGGITATPKMIDTIEDLYTEIYGELIKTDFTIDDAKNDSEFWNTYCTYDSIVSDNEDGTYSVAITYNNGKITDNIILDAKADKMLSMGTMYLTTLYYYICYKYNEEPYSDSALSNQDLVAEYQSVAAGGCSLEYIRNNTELSSYFNSSAYLDSGTSSIGNYDIELLSAHVKSLSLDGSNVVLIATGKSIDESAYSNITNAVSNQGGMATLFITASDIPNAFANIECIGYVLGYEDYARQLVEDLQLRLYTVYYSLQQKSNEVHKVYWEDSTAEAVRSSGMSKSIMNFMGWDTSLLTGAEVDTETLLYEKPDILIFYSNDTRSDDTKMRCS